MNKRLRSEVIAIISGAFHVWFRNILVFRKNLLVNFFPPFVEPIFYLAAMGFGIGSFVQEVEGMPFVRFIAPGILAGSVMNAAFFECAYGTYVRMYYQKTIDAMMTTPLTLDEIILGEILWGATRGLISAASILVILIIAGLADLPLCLLALPIGFSAGFLFAAIATCFSAKTPSIEAISYPATLFIAPMFLFSGTFFPLSLLPEPLQVFALAALPLTHVVALMRFVIVGTPAPIWPLHVIWILLGSIVMTIIALKLFRKRLII